MPDGFRYLVLRDQRELRRVATGETTLAAITLDHTVATSSMEARRRLKPTWPDGYVISEAYCLELIEDYKQLAARCAPSAGALAIRPDAPAA